jgi:hypothetical protein
MLKNLFIFSLGAAAGAFVAWRIVKTKYEQIAQEEIDSVREMYRSRLQDEEEPEQVEDEVTPTNKGDFSEMPDVKDYLKILQQTQYTEDINYQKVEEEQMSMRPYVISPEDFGEHDDYETISLTYYADGTLTDSTDEPIEDVEYVVGEDSLTHFGEYEDDSVFVRNDRLRTDYEILLDTRNYSDVVRRGPRPTED